MNVDLEIQKKEPEADGSEGEGTDEEEDNYADPQDQFEEDKKVGEEMDEEDDGYDYMDDSLDLREKSPKKTLIDHLRLMSDIFNSSIDGASDYYD